MRRPKPRDTSSNRPKTPGVPRARCTRTQPSRRRATRARVRRLTGIATETPTDMQALRSLRDWARSIFDAARDIVEATQERVES